MSFEGKVALVTGAGRNLGRAIALDYAAHGANVVVNVRSNLKEAEAVAQEAERAGVKALAYAADVSNPEAVNKMVEAAVERFGRVDILVSNAAVRRHSTFAEITYQEWRDLIGIILDGAFNCAKAVIPHMITNNYGRIVMIGGDGALAGSGNGVAVSSAKNGTIGLMRSLAKGHLKHNIRVNMLSPARLATGWEQDATGRGRGDAPVGRPGTTKDISRACLFLTDEDADYITGEILHVNGGGYTW